MMDLLAQHDSGRAALVDTRDSSELSYGELAERVTEAAGLLRRHLERGLVFLATTTTPESVILYLACLEAGSPVCLLDPAAPTDRLIGSFAPDALLLPAPAESPAGFSPAADPFPGKYRMFTSDTRQPRTFHPDLALLLTTSGSTGSPKLVRLTRRNLLSNAASIAEYLGITPDDRDVLSLPMHYSYGMSLINSNLLAGASVALTAWSFLEAPFWPAFTATKCTSFAGVPYVYETLARLRFEPSRYPTLRTMTQAGGALRPDLTRLFREKAAAAGKRLFVMYGQTEASPRISYVPWERLGEKIGSIGIAIPGGRLDLEPVEGMSAQELIYSGPNVMMGYASAAEDLARGDTQQGKLRTGDLAERDSEGFYYLRGRLQRFAKLFGKRISLEDVELDLERTHAVSVVVVERGQGLHIFVAGHAQVEPAAIALGLARQLNVPPGSIGIESLAALPLTSTGKKDYKALA